MMHDFIGNRDRFDDDDVVDKVVEKQTRGDKLTKREHRVIAFVDYRALAAKVDDDDFDWRAFERAREEALGEGEFTLMSSGQRARVEKRENKLADEAEFQKALGNKSKRARVD